MVNGALLSLFERSPYRRNRPTRWHSGPMQASTRTACLWAGTATIGTGWAAFSGTVGDHAVHRHHAVQLVLGIDSPVQLVVERNTRALEGAGCRHRGGGACKERWNRSSDRRRAWHRGRRTTPASPA